MDLHTLIGLAGVAGYVTAYLLLQLGFLDGNGVRYSVANVVAAALVLVSLTDEFNLASALIQVIWIVVGVTGLLLRVTRKRAAFRSDTSAASVHSQTAELSAPPRAHQGRAQAMGSPFRVAAQPAPRAELGLRADVLDAFQAASSPNRA